MFIIRNLFQLVSNYVDEAINMQQKVIFCFLFAIICAINYSYKQDTYLLLTNSETLITVPTLESD